MAGSAEEAVRRGIYTRLNADATLSALVTDVYQRVPENATLPYVAIWESTEQPFNTYGKTGRDIRLNIDAWSNDIRRDRAYDIANRVDQLLDFTSALTVTGYTVTAVELDFRNVFHEAEYIHISSRYRVRVQES